MAEKKSFILYFDYKQQVDLLTDEQAGQLFKALFDFAVSGKIPEFSDGMLTMAFSFMSAQIERDTQKYTRKCERNKEIALERERKKKESKDVHECRQTCTNVTDNDNDNDNVTDNDNDNDNVTDNENDNGNENVTDNEINKRTGKPSKAPKPVRKKFGEYENVLLTDEQYKKLIEDYGECRINDYIQKIDEWIQMKGKSPYKDFNIAIRKWLKRDGIEKGIDEDVKPLHHGVVI